MSARSIERAIEEACESLLSARTYMVSNSIPVRRYGDGDVEVGLRQAIVRCSELENMNISAAGGGLYWKCRVDFMGYAPIASDKNQSYIDGLYEELRLAASSFTVSSIAPTGVTIHGKTMGTSSEEFDDRIRMRGINFQLFISNTEA